MLLKKNIKKKNNKNQYKEAINKFNIVIFHVFCTFNNTIITLSDIKGNTMYWSTSSSVGFKSSKKSTSYAAQAAAEKVARYSFSKGFVDARIFIKGVGVGRDYSIRGIFNSGINILSVCDVTKIPHNGCKCKKIRRK